MIKCHDLLSFQCIQNSHWYRILFFLFSPPDRYQDNERIFEKEMPFFPEQLLGNFPRVYIRILPESSTSSDNCLYLLIKLHHTFYNMSTVKEYEANKFPCVLSFWQLLFNKLFFASRNKFSLCLSQRDNVLVK